MKVENLGVCKVMKRIVSTEIGPRSFEKQPLDISPLKRTKRNPQGYMPRDYEGF